MYMYLLPCKIGTNVGVNILASKKLSTSIECPIFIFLEDWQPYKHGVSLEVVLQVLKPIILSDMVCLNIFGGGVVTYVCMVTLIHAYRLYDFMFSKWISLNIDFLKSCLLVFKKINVRFLKSFRKISKEIVVRWWLQCVFACWLVLWLGTLQFRS